MFGSEAIDVEYSVSYRGGSQLQVSVLASGFKATRYDEYDPLSSLNSIDDGMEYSLPSGLEIAQTLRLTGLTLLNDVLLQGLKVRLLDPLEEGFRFLDFVSRLQTWSPSRRPRDRRERPSRSRAASKGPAS